MLTSHHFVPLSPDPTTMVELWKDSPQGLVKEGDTVELRCQGDGNPPPSFIFNSEQVSGKGGGGGFDIWETSWNVFHMQNS